MFSLFQAFNLPPRIYISLYQFSFLLLQSVSSSIKSESSTQRLQMTPVILQKHVKNNNLKMLMQSLF